MTEQRMKMWCPKCVGDNFRVYQVMDGPRRISLSFQCTHCLTIMTADAAFEMTTTQHDQEL